MNLRVLGVDPDAYRGATCVTWDGANLWDPRADGEPARQALKRWREAAALCRTRCPAINTCRAEHAVVQDPLSVWAGQVPPGTKWDNPVAKTPRPLSNEMSNGNKQ